MINCSTRGSYKITGWNISFPPGYIIFIKHKTIFTAAIVYSFKQIIWNRNDYMNLQNTIIKYEPWKFDYIFYPIFISGHIDMIFIKFQIRILNITWFKGHISLNLNTAMRSNPVTPFTNMV